MKNNNPHLMPLCPKCLNIDYLHCVGIDAYCDHCGWQSWNPADQAWTTTLKPMVRTVCPRCSTIGALYYHDGQLCCSTCECPGRNADSALISTAEQHKDITEYCQCNSPDSRQIYIAGNMVSVCHTCKKEIRSWTNDDRDSYFHLDYCRIKPVP